MMKKDNKFRIREKVLLLMAVGSLGIGGMQMAGAAGPEGSIEHAAVVFQQEAGNSAGNEYGEVEAVNADVADEDFDGTFSEDDYFQLLATAIGIDVDTLVSELDSGQSLAEIATANDVDSQVVIDALVANENAMIDEMEQSNKVSAEEAAEWRAESADTIAFEVNNASPDVEAISAGVIGISVDALWEEIDAGLTIAEVATANGVEPQAVIDAAVSAEYNYVDAKVAAGLVEATVASEWKVEIATNVDGIVNSPQTVFDNDFYEGGDQDGDYAIDTYFITAATAIGIDEETLHDELHEGKSIADVATANGVDPQDLIATMVAVESAFIDEMAQAGDISAEEAADWHTELADYIAFDVHHATPDREAVAAATIGISVEELWAELAKDKTIADVAAANNVDPQAVFDATVAADTEYVDAMLAAGLLEEADADEWKDEIVIYVTYMIGSTFDEIGYEDDFYEDDDYAVEYEGDFYEDDDYEGGDEYGDYAIDTYFITAGTAIGIDEDTLHNELHEGKSIAEVATAHGVDPQTVIDTLIVIESAFIDEMEQWDEITSDIATEWRAEMADYITFDVHHAMPIREAVAADAIGVSVEDLWAEVEAGKTFADVATDNNVDPQAVFDAVVSADTEYVDAMLAAGLLEVADADEWKAEIVEYTTNLVNNTQPLNDNTGFEDDWSVSE